MFDRLLILRWKGTSWKRAPVPNPGAHGGDSWLYGVTAGSAKSVWAAGTYFVGANQRTLVEHWNGTRWKRIASTNPAGPGSSDVLQGIGGTSCSDIWAVGYSFNAVSNPFLPLAARR